MESTADCESHRTLNGISHDDASMMVESSGMPVLLSTQRFAWGGLEWLGQENRLTSADRIGAISGRPKIICGRKDSPTGMSVTMPPRMKVERASLRLERKDGMSSVNKVV